MAYVHVKIDHLDGTTEAVHLVQDVEVRDGILRLSRRRSISGEREDLGNYPLASIRRYTTTPA